MKSSVYKNFTFFITIIYFILGCSNTKQDKPEQLLSNFNKLYPHAQNVAWEFNDSIWIATFNDDKSNIAAEFNKSGEWLQTNSPVKNEDIPVVVIDKINGFYNGYTISKSELVNKPGFKGYGIIIDVNNQKIELLISESGDLRKAVRIN